MGLNHRRRRICDARNPYPLPISYRPHRTRHRHRCFSPRLHSRPGSTLPNATEASNRAPPPSHRDREAGSVQRKLAPPTTPVPSPSLPKRVNAQPNAPPLFHFTDVPPSSLLVATLPAAISPSPSYPTCPTHTPRSLRLRSPHRCTPPSSSRPGSPSTRTRPPTSPMLSATPSMRDR